jgi:unconventional prefoldin RPB5 interactor 1
VLLGESYYAERSAKQTVEILQRRGKTLEAQIESLKAIISDLEAEAKFFSSTATEAAVSQTEKSHCFSLLVLILTIKLNPLLNKF